MLKRKRCQEPFLNSDTLFSLLDAASDTVLLSETENECGKEMRKRKAASQGSNPVFGFQCRGLAFTGVKAGS